MLSCLLAGCVVNERTRQSHLLPGMLREHLQQITTAAKGESGHHNSTWSRLSLAARSCHMLGGGDTFWAVRGHSITRRYQRRIGAAIASYISSRYLQFCRHGFGRRRDRRRRNHQRRQRRRCHRQPPPRFRSFSDGRAGEQQWPLCHNRRRGACFPGANSGDATFPPPVPPATQRPGFIAAWPAAKSWNGLARHHRQRHRYHLDSR